MTQTRAKPKFQQVTKSFQEPVKESVKQPKEVQAANFWQNLSFQWKLALVLVATSAVPVIVVTQTLTRISGAQFFENAQINVQEKETTFAQEYVLWTNEEAKADAETIADAVENAGVNTSNLKQTVANRAVQQSLVLKTDAEPESIKTFKIITDAQGKTVAQEVQVLAEQLTNKPPLPSDKAPVNHSYRTIPLPSGISLRDLPIVQDTLNIGRPLAGVELINPEILGRLGLQEQAAIGVRSQITEGLPENKQPFPEGTYNIDGGRVGLVSMAVSPIKVNNRVVGTAIVGTLLNRNYGIPDKFRESYGNTMVATIFAKDWRVATNVPYIDPETKKPDQTRATGTRVAREVAETVLNQEQTFIGKTNIVGVDYLTGYSPLYDHRKEFDPKAKPVGMSFVGQPLTTFDERLRSQELIGYSVGAGIVILMGLISVPLAGTFSRPLRELAGFAQQVADGETDVRLEDTERQDEIGILTRDLNEMAASIETNMKSVWQEVVREQILKEVSLQLTQFPQVKNSLDLALEAIRLGLQVDRIIAYRFNENTWQGTIIGEAIAEDWHLIGSNKIDNLYSGEQSIEDYRQGSIQAINNIYEGKVSRVAFLQLESMEVKSSLVVPILRGSRGYLAGLLIVHQCSALRVWEEAEINLLSQIGIQMGLTLDRINLVDRTRAAARRAQAVKDIAISLSQAANTDVIFETAVEETRQALQSDRVLVYCFDENWAGTITNESVAQEFPSALGWAIADPCFAEKYVDKYKEGRVKATPDIHAAGLTDCHLQQLEPFGVKANLVAPILVEGELLGLLVAHQCSGVRNWEQTEIDFFSQIAIQIGVAVDRVNLLKSQQTTAEEQKLAKEVLQKRALELLIEVDPVSRGDLTIRASVTDDEIGTIADAYNSTIENLRKLVTQVQKVTQQLTTTTVNNETSVEVLSTEAVRQAEQISDALNQMRVMTESMQAVSNNAKKALSTVQEATETVEQGEVAMNRTVEGMMAIRETVAETSKKIERLGESSQKISKVVSLISRFAAQTHLLALKASIEAARAGEEGRGFAVIADEVRSLAAQSAEATAEIETLVSNIQSETKEVVTTMEIGSEQVVEGSKLVDETRKSLTQMTTASTQINKLVAAITKVAIDQAQTSQSVTQTMTDVAAIAENTSTSATDVSASFKELLAITQELQEDVDQFKVS